MSVFIDPRDHPWAHTNNPGASPHFKVLNFSTSAKSLLPCEAQDDTDAGVWD